MGERRCRYEWERFDACEFEPRGGLLVHVRDGNPVAPAHEAIEGRLLNSEDDTWITVPIPVSGVYSIRNDR